MKFSILLFSLLFSVSLYSDTAIKFGNSPKVYRPGNQSGINIQFANNCKGPDLKGYSFSHIKDGKIYRKKDGKIYRSDYTSCTHNGRKQQKLVLIFVGFDG